MLKTRLMPVLLLRGLGLVKTIKFADPKYVGDPINAVRIFNEKEVDELVFLDITATIDGKKPQFELVRKIGSECFIPFAYGGGIRHVDDIRQILRQGAEKAVMNTCTTSPTLIKEASEVFGSQSIVVSVDVKKVRKKYFVHTHSGTVNTKLNPVEFAKSMEEMGAGELLINNIDRDGTMEGYDLEIIKQITDVVSIPVIACGGAGALQDFKDAVRIGGASAVAAGSLFVFHGPHRAVLINYPIPSEIEGYLD